MYFCGLLSGRLMHWSSQDEFEAMSQQIDAEESEQFINKWESREIRALIKWYPWKMESNNRNKGWFTIYIVNIVY